MARAVPCRNAGVPAVARVRLAARETGPPIGLALPLFPSMQRPGQRPGRTPDAPAPGGPPGDGRPAFRQSTSIDGNGSEVPSANNVELG